MTRTTVGALLMAAALSAYGADAPPPNAPETTDEPAVTTTSAPAEQAPATTEPQNPEQAPGRPPSTGSLRETVTETLRTFTPSEAIDVDKPVDFPANI